MPGRAPSAAARPPGTGFLHRSVLAATAAISAALTLVVLPAYLILARCVQAISAWAPRPGRRRRGPAQR